MPILISLLNPATFNGKKCDIHGQIQLGQDILSLISQVLCNSLLHTGTMGLSGHLVFKSEGKLCPFRGIGMFLVHPLL